MEEDEYKSTYNELTSIRCVFEKALTNNHATCRYARHFCLADREGYSCTDDASSQKCDALLIKLRQKSRFILKVPVDGAALPHNMEVRIQVGGIRGIARLAKTQTSDIDQHTAIHEISENVEAALTKYGNLNDLPYSDVMQSIEQFRGRRRRGDR